MKTEKELLTETIAKMRKEIHRLLEGLSDLCSCQYKGDWCKACQIADPKE